MRLMALHGDFSRIFRLIFPSVESNKTSRVCRYELDIAKANNSKKSLNLNTFTLYHWCVINPTLVFAL